MAVTADGKNRIMIFGPKTGGKQAASGRAERRCKPFPDATAQKMIAD